MQNTNKIILYDFINDDADYKDAMKDFDGGDTTVQNPNKKKDRNR